MDKIDTRRFWLGAVLAVAGVVMLFVALFIPPQGEISGSALGAVGEVFLLSGAILGLDSYISFKMKNFIQEAIGNEKDVKADETNKE